ncbi:hypothetical protein D3C72_2056120 [compost metagenome]
MSVPTAMGEPVLAAAMARTPVPQPTSRTLSKVSVASRWSKASRQPTVVPWWPVPNAAPASIFRLTRPSGILP